MRSHAPVRSFAWRWKFTISYVLIVVATIVILGLLRGG